LGEHETFPFLQEGMDRFNSFRTFIEENKELRREFDQHDGNAAFKRCEAFLESLAQTPDTDTRMPMRSEWRLGETVEPGVRKAQPDSVQAARRLGLMDWKSSDFLIDRCRKGLCAQSVLAGLPMICTLEHLERHCLRAVEQHRQMLQFSESDDPHFETRPVVKKILFDCECIVFEYIGPEPVPWRAYHASQVYMFGCDHETQTIEFPASPDIRVLETRRVTVLKDQTYIDEFVVWYDREFCCLCGKPARVGTFKRCGRCKRQKYCGIECQVLDWRVSHKVHCIAMVNQY